MKIYIPQYQQPKNFTLVLYRNGFQKAGMIERLETRSLRRFTNKLNSLPDNICAYIRVSYVDFGANWGEYRNKADLIFMFKAFIWEEIAL